MQILISTSNFDLNNFSNLDDIKSAGISVKLNPFAKRLTQQQSIDLLGTDTVGLIAGLEPLNELVLKSATSLKVIARVGTGLDSVLQMLSMFLFQVKNYYLDLLHKA